MPLRPHQQKGINEIRAKIKEGYTSIIRQAPTGSGKTYEFAYITLNAIKKGSKVCILSNREEILKQAGSSVYQMGIAPGYISAGTQTPPMTKATIAMAQTLRRRINDKRWDVWFRSIDILIVDECHLQDFNPFLEDNIFSRALILGFSATPKRTGGMRQLALDYQAIVKGPQVLDAIKAGFLVPENLFKTSSPDMSDVGYDSKSGDYQTSSMYAKFNTPEVYGGLVENYKKYANGQVMLTFCVNIQHTIRTCKELNDAGIESKFLVSSVAKPKKPKLDASEGKWVIYEDKIKAYEEYQKALRDGLTGVRKDILNGYHRGKYKSLVNSGILTAGYDFPAIQTIAVCRATLSEQLWLQMLGRGARICPEIGKKSFNLFDFGGNTDRLGAYQIDRDWHLWHSPSKGGGVAPVKQCGMQGQRERRDVNNKAGCKRLILATYKICPFCGFKFLSEKELKKIELEEHLYDAQTGKMKPIKNMSVDELYSYSKLQGYKPGWFERKTYHDKGKEVLVSFLNENNYSFGYIDRVIEKIEAEIVY